MLISSALFGQSHFPTDSAEWKLGHFRFDPPNLNSEFVVYRYSGDTVLNGFIYHELTLSNQPGLHFVRNDTINNRLYIRPGPIWGLGAYSKNTDYLLYDFGRTIDDSIAVVDLYTLDSVYWKVIADSTILIDGELRRYIDVERDYFGTTQVDRWVEGLGSLNELLAPIIEPSGYFEFAYQLVCFTDLATGFQYKPDSLWAPSFNCDASLDNQNALTLDEFIKCFPNPFSSQLNLEFPGEGVGQVKVINAHGVEMYKSTHHHNESIKINAEFWPDGIYWLIIETTGFTRAVILLHD